MNAILQFVRTIRKMAVLYPDIIKIGIIATRLKYLIAHSICLCLREAACTSSVTSILEYKTVSLEFSHRSTESHCSPSLLTFIISFNYLLLVPPWLKPDIKPLVRRLDARAQHLTACSIRSCSRAAAVISSLYLLGYPNTRIQNR